MSKLSNLIKRLKNIKETFDAESETAEKIQDIIDRLEANEPTSTIVARLLADLIEKLGGELGPLGDWISAYAQAFRDAIDAILRIVYGRYKRARDMGLTHDEAKGLVTSDRETAEWLRFKYAFDNMPESEDEENGDIDETDEYNDLEVPGESSPPPRPSKPAEPLWAKKHHKCCKDLTPKQRDPVFNLIGKRIYLRRGSRYIDFQFEITHACGLKQKPQLKYLVAAGSRWIEIPNPRVPGRPFQLKITSAVGGKGFRYSITRMQIQMSGNQTAKVDIRAISNCIGLLAEQREI